MFVLWTSALVVVALGCWAHILHPSPTRAVTRPLRLRRTRRCTDRLLRELAESGQLVPPLPRREDDVLAAGRVTIVDRRIVSHRAPTNPSRQATAPPTWLPDDSSHTDTGSSSRRQTRNMNGHNVTVR